MHERDRTASASVADILDTPTPLRELLLRHGDVDELLVGITRSGED